MSMVPVTPNMDKLKSFWQQPQGKVGMAVLGLGGVAIVLAFMNYLLPYAATFVDGWLHILMTGGVCVFLVWFYLNFHRRFSMMFRILITKLTNLFFHVMPLDVLKDNIHEMKKRQAELDQQRAVFKGQVRNLSDTMARNNADIDKFSRQAVWAKNQLNNLQPNTEDYLTHQAEATSAAQRAQRKRDSNESYGAMLKQMTAIDSLMGRMQIAVNFFVEDRTNLVEETEQKYKMLKSGRKAIATASGILHGNVDDETIFQDALATINEQDSQFLGDIDNYQDMAKKWLEQADMSTGAMNDRAMEQLTAYEQKMLTPGSALTNMRSASEMLAGPKRESIATPVAIPSGYRGGDDYFSK